MNVRAVVANELARQGMNYTAELNPTTGLPEVHHEGKVVSRLFLDYEEADRFCTRMNRFMAFRVSTTLRTAINERYALRH